MSMERIREAIIEEAEEKAREIESEARQRCDERLQRGKEDMEQEFQNKFKQERAKIERKCERRVIQERSQHNLALLEHRNEILDQLFEKATQQISNLPADEYQDLLAKWINEVPEDTSGTIVCHTDDVDRIRPLVDDLNASRSEDAQLDLKEADHPKHGGVIFQTGKFEIDMSVKTRINTLREELAPVIAEKVFPGGLKV